MIRVLCAVVLMTSMITAADDAVHAFEDEKMFANKGLTGMNTERKDALKEFADGLSELRTIITGSHLLHHIYKGEPI